jgi:hypothetical protein
MNTEKARQMLRAAGVFYFDEESELLEDEGPKWLQTLNMNDTWGWALADCEYVSDEELSEVGDLFFKYGWCGILYWVSEKRGGMKSEFADINRFIEFVRNEENIIKEIPSSSKRAYIAMVYTIGNDEKGKNNDKESQI